MGAPDIRELEAELYNSGYFVRHYHRPFQKRQRAQAILRMGLAVRDAFNRSDDFEPLLIAFYMSLSQKDDRPPF